MTRRHAFTLVETVLSTIMVSVLLCAALSATISARGGSVVASERALALDLAEELLAEIMQQAYVDPEAPEAASGPDVGETGRTDFDDVDDYSGWKQSPPQDIEGQAIAGCAGLTRMVSLLGSGDAGYDIKSPLNELCIIVRVEVYRGSLLLCRLDGLRNAAGAAEAAAGGGK